MWEQLTDFLFLDCKFTADCDYKHEITRQLLLGRKVMTNLENVFKKQRCHLAHKDMYSQGYGLSSSYVLMWELHNKGGRVSKNWCFWTVVLGETLASPLDSKKIKSVNLKGNHCQIIFQRTDGEAEIPILWPTDANSWLIGKDPDAQKDLRQKVKRKQGWDCWMSSSIQWTWIWANSRRWWGTRKICILQSMWSCRVRYNLATEFNFFIILVYLLLIALGLHCCTWAFSSCREQELTSSSSAQASHWNGFYCYGAQALEASVSVSAACRVSN